MGRNVSWGERRAVLIQELFLPCLMFASIGGMVWAVRGCSGFGGEDGCTFAGITWAAAWHFLSREPRTHRSRRYSSGWVLVAMAFLIGYSGNRGWMQWPGWCEGRLYINYPEQIYRDIDPIYGRIWTFIAGVPWAGLGAVGLAWCGSKSSLGRRGWALRIACGLAGAAIGLGLLKAFPQVFLPFYDQLNYSDGKACPNLQRILHDQTAAVQHMGLYLGFLSFEILRRDWRNVALILIVGITNGLGWASLQYWHWAEEIWPTAQFNFWRCWETSGGLSIGLAYGLAFFLCNRPIRSKETGNVAPASAMVVRPNLERIGIFLGLVLGLGWSIKCGFKGWANIYIGNEHYWEKVGNWVFVALAACVLILLVRRFLRNPFPQGFEGDSLPHYATIFWGVLFIQNALAQIITGPHSNWSEVVFAIYYVLLFLITASVTCCISAYRERH